MVFLFSFIPSVKATDSITYVGGIIYVIGFTEEDPCSIWEIWNASDINGWGVVHNNDGENLQYDFDVPIYVGKFTIPPPIWNEGHLGDEGVSIAFGSTVSSPHITLVDGSLRFGELVNETEKQGMNGVTVVTYKSTPTIIEASMGKLNLYASHFDCRSGQGEIKSLATTRIWGCTFNNVQYTLQDVTDISRFNHYGMYFTFQLSSDLGTFEDVYSHSVWACVSSFASFGGTLKNLRLENNTYVAYLNTFIGNFNLINGDVENWAIYWQGANVGKLYRQYEFDLTVTYPNGTLVNGTETGAYVTIQNYGENATTHFSGTLGSDGTISTQVFTMGHYNFTGGDTIYNYNPYNIQVSNLAGFLDYS